MRFLDHKPRFALALAAALAIAIPSHAPAQSWPSRPVTMVAPFPAGGNNDVIARAIAAALSERLGKQFVVDNRGGAGGNIGAAVVAKAPPDGYTLLFSSPGAIAQNKLMYRNMSYDPDRDFQPVVLVANSPLIIAARKAAPFDDLKGLVAFAKANPGKLNVGNAGQGTIGHITSVLLQMTAGISVVDVPYRGSAPAMTDLLGGQIDAQIDFMTAYIPLVKDGTIKVIALTSSRRSPALPEAPTVIETGVANFEALAWYAIMAPTGTPTEVVQKINAAVNEWLKTDKAKDLLADMAMQANGGSPDDLKAFIASEIAKWGPVIKAANIQF
jgi:tripartite-type tricarboxylate transporter receptor subunit TctC